MPIGGRVGQVVPSPSWKKMISPTVHTPPKVLYSSSMALEFFTMLFPFIGVPESAVPECQCLWCA